jgi:menaquinone-dependent protoporphyrinogen oxidase
VLVVYATRHGSTQQIAERIADRLRERSLDVTLRSADRADEEVAAYDAAIIGSAVYAAHWLKDAAELVRRSGTALASRPVWLFSSGPLGADSTDAKGREVREAAKPREYAEFSEAIHPRDHHVFFGAYDPVSDPVGIMETFLKLVPGGRTGLPDGDFRDWDEIDGWAARIADALSATPDDEATAGTSGG